MKATFLVSIPCSLILMLASNGLCQVVVQNSASADARASAHDLIGSPADDGDQTSDQALDASIASVPILRTSASAGSANAFAYSEAFAVDGKISLRTFAMASADGPPQSNIQDNYTAAGATANASGSITDVLTLSNVQAASGTPIIIIGGWNLSGSVASSASGGQPVSKYITAAGHSELSVTGSGIDPLLNGGFLAEDTHTYSGIANDPNSPYVGGTHTDAVDFFPVAIHTIAGVPIPFTITVHAQSVGLVQSYDNATSLGGEAGGTADFSHTILWGGITSVTDGNGVPLIGWSVTSASGYDYSKPYGVPEPTTGVLAAIVALALGGVRRRHRSN